MENVGILYGRLVYLSIYGYLVYLCSLWPFFLILVSCTEKNLATLLGTHSLSLFFVSGSGDVVPLTIATAFAKYDKVSKY
jgi:hypothetical protein